tara:strand:+ start:39 stop:983 length:945 start_codon:yes stop_codon:yes gene_type:complete
MSRPLRIEFPGAIYHITARANAQQRLFTNPKDAKYFLDLLDREICQHKWICYAYCLLENHYHLVIETPEPNLGRGMGRLNMSYSQWFGRIHDQPGHLFQGRYKTILFQKNQHLLEVCRHVVLNPVRLGLVDRADRWRWSSYRPLAFGSSEPQWLNDDWLQDQFKSRSSKPNENWKKYVLEENVYSSPWENLRAGQYLGDEEYLKNLGNRINGLPLDQVSKKFIRPDRPTPKKVLKCISDACGVSEENLLDRNVSQEGFRASVYLLRRACNLSLKKVAEMGNVSQSRISQIQKSIDDKGGISVVFPWGKALLKLL